MITIYKKKWIPGYENKYFATSDGKIYRQCKNRKSKLLTGYHKKTNYIVKLTINGESKTHQYARIIWETFNGPIKEGHVIVRKNGIKIDNSLNNLEQTVIQKHGMNTGGASKSKEVVMLDEEGNEIDWFKSAREAGRKLNCSYQTISDICNKKVKKPMFLLEWCEEQLVTKGKIKYVIRNLEGYVVGRFSSAEEAAGACGLTVGSFYSAISKNRPIRRKYMIEKKVG